MGGGELKHISDRNKHRFILMNFSHEIKFKFQENNFSARGHGYFHSLFICMVNTFNFFLICSSVFNTQKLLKEQKEHHVQQLYNILWLINEICTVHGVYNACR